MRFLRRSRKGDVDVASCLANLDRLAAVERTGLRGAPRSDRLDAITDQAAASLDTPMALITILDDEHQWFASEHGLPGDLREAGRCPVGDSYCQHVVANDDVFVVNDSRSDELVADSPFTTDRGIQSYLGVPLRSDGQVLGAVCVADTQPREWTEADRAALEELAARVLEPAS